MIERINKTSNKTTRYEWDIENQLIKVTTHETENAMPSETITYAYDGLGRRIEKNINGKIKSYIYDNEDILAEFDEEGLFEKYYVHGMGIDNPLAMLDNEFENGRDNFTYYYYHKDGMNSITSLTDKDGKEVEKYIYNAFGKMTIYDERDNKIEASQFDNPYSFTGREHDSETGLHYHRARYYSPELARWISEDPIEFNSGDMNLYRYVMNNPMKYTDPNGEIIKEFNIFKDYYKEMVKFGHEGADTYFHCMANCMASSKHNPEVAKLLSQLREDFDDAEAWIREQAHKICPAVKLQPNNRRIDEAANRLGRLLGTLGYECKTHCILAVSDNFSETKKVIREKYLQ